MLSLPAVSSGTYRSRKYRLINGDIMDFVQQYHGAKFHAILSDPPYNLDSISKRFGKRNSSPAKQGVYGRSSRGFMGKEWDTDIAFNPELWERLSDHLLPGGFIMAFSSTRTYHRMACAIEDAGLIIHPMIAWTFGSGFPKATRIDTQIDKHAGVSQPTIGVGSLAATANAYGWYPSEDTGLFPITAPVTNLAQEWSGHRYGLQALKPAFEPICVAQKPYGNSPIRDITSTAAGAWNIEAGRIPGESWGERSSMNNIKGGAYANGVTKRIELKVPNAMASGGRWPANLVLTHDPLCNGHCVEGCPVLELDRQSGVSRAGSSVSGNEPSTSGGKVYSGRFDRVPFESHDDTGGASRYFHRSDWSYEIAEQLANVAPFYYEGKATSSEREDGLDDFEMITVSDGRDKSIDNAYQRGETVRRNPHPTVKPIKLTQYLASLLLPPDSYAPRRLLVPFAGSGSEMIGAFFAGWDEIVGIELSHDYAQVARTRLDHYIAPEKSSRVIAPGVVQASLFSEVTP